MNKTTTTTTSKCLIAAPSDETGSHRRRFSVEEGDALQVDVTVIDALWCKMGMQNLV